MVAILVSRVGASGTSFYTNLDVLKEVDHGVLVTSERSGAAPGRRRQAVNILAHFLESRGQRVEREHRADYDS